MATDGFIDGEHLFTLEGCFVIDPQVSSDVSRFQIRINDEEIDPIVEQYDVDSEDELPVGLYVSEIEPPFEYEIDAGVFDSKDELRRLVLRSLVDTLVDLGYDAHMGLGHLEQD